MKEEIVRFNNDLNKQNFAQRTLRGTHLSTTDLDLLFALISQVWNKKDSLLTLSFNNLREKTAFKTKNMSDTQLRNVLGAFNKNLQNVQCTIPTHTLPSTFNLFSTFHPDLNAKTLKFRINPPFTFLFNNVTSRFTRFNLSTLVNCNSVNSQRLLLILAQWREMGECFIPLQQLKKQICLPYPGQEYTNRLKRTFNRVDKDLGKELHLKKTAEYQVGDSQKLKGYYFKFKFPPDQYDEFREDRDHQIALPLSGNTQQQRPTISKTSYLLTPRELAWQMRSQE